MFPLENAASLLILLITGFAAFSTLYIICTRLERDREIERMVRDARDLRDRQMKRIAELRGEAPPADEDDAFIVGESIEDAQEIGPEAGLASAA